MVGPARRADPKLEASLALEVLLLWDQSNRHGNSAWVVLPVVRHLGIERRDRHELNLLVEPERTDRTRAGFQLVGMVQRLYQ